MDFTLPALVTAPISCGVELLMGIDRSGLHSIDKLGSITPVTLPINMLQDFIGARTASTQPQK